MENQDLNLAVQQMVDSVRGKRQRSSETMSTEQKRLQVIEANKKGWSNTEFSEYLVKNFGYSPNTANNMIGAVRSEFRKEVKEKNEKLKKLQTQSEKVKELVNNGRPVKTTLGETLSNDKVDLLLKKNDVAIRELEASLVEMSQYFEKLKLKGGNKSSTSSDDTDIEIDFTDL